MNVIQFPVHKRMPSRIAEEKIGNFLKFWFPDDVADRDEYVQRYVGKYVLLGWEAIQSGLVVAFRLGRVRHVVRRVAVDQDLVPLVTVSCDKGVQYRIFNWQGAAVRAGSLPAVLLSVAQARYFPVCKRCSTATKPIMDGTDVFGASYDDDG